MDNILLSGEGQFTVNAVFSGGGGSAIPVPQFPPHFFHWWSKTQQERCLGNEHPKQNLKRICG